MRNYTISSGGDLTGDDGTITIPYQNPYTWNRWWQNCPKCGKCVECGDKYCKHCGHQLYIPKYCPHCGKEIAE